MNNHYDVDRRGFLSAGAGAAAAALINPHATEAAPSKPRVAVGRGGVKMEPDKAAYIRLKAALDKHGGFAELVKGKRVLVKINATDKTSQDANTSISTTAATLRLIRENEAKNVVVLGQEWYGYDCPRKGRPTLREIIKKEGAELKELTHWWLKTNDYVKRVPKGGGWKEYWVAKDIFEPDTVLINVARLKTHHFTIYTGCVKNCIGLTYHMYAHHCTDDKNPKAGASDKHPARMAGWKLFPAKLSAAYHGVFQPRLALNILDADEPTYGWGGPKPERIHTFKAGVVAVSTDALAVDAFGAQLLHEDRPKVIPTALADWTVGDSVYVKANLTQGNYLAECHKLGAGQGDLGKIQIDEVSID